MKYSIVIPVHNEAENIENFVVAFLQGLSKEIKDVLIEVLLVENGSTDETLDACTRLKQRFPDLVRVFSNSRGSYGEAIKRGILESRGSHLSILECDVLDTNFVAASVEMFARHGARFIVASKQHPDSQDGRPLKRRILTKVFNRILAASTGYPGTDTHGLKSIETGLAKRLCEQAITTDEVFQTEIVLLAWRQGVTIKELPIWIAEIRPTPVSIKKRFPMVVNSVRLLRRSLARFPKGTATTH